MFKNLMCLIKGMYWSCGTPYEQVNKHM